MVSFRLPWRGKDGGRAGLGSAASGAPDGGVAAPRAEDSGAAAEPGADSPVPGGSVTRAMSVSARASEQSDVAMRSGGSTHASDRVLSLLREGKTVHQVALQTGTSEVFVKVMLDHFERIGMARSAASLCSSGLGACSSSGEALSMQAQIVCAGCPLKLPKNLG